MKSILQFLGQSLNNLLAFVLMTVLAVVSSFSTLVVVDWSAAFAGLDPDDQFLVLSAPSSSPPRSSPAA